MNQGGVAGLRRTREVLLEGRHRGRRIALATTQQAQRAKGLHRRLRGGAGAHQVSGGALKVARSLAQAIDLAARETHGCIVGGTREAAVEQGQALLVLAASHLGQQPIEAMTADGRFEGGCTQLAAATTGQCADAAGGVFMDRRPALSRRRVFFSLAAS